MGFIVKSLHPTQSAGFARSQAQALNPGLYDDLVSYLSPIIGHPGLIMQDLSQRGNVGNVVDATYVSTDGVEGGGNFLFAGSDPTPEYLQIDNADDLNFGTGDFSVSLWMKRPSPTICQILNKGIGGQGHGATGNHYAISTNNDTLKWSVGDGSIGGEAAKGTSGISDGAWHLIIGTKQADGLRLYLDGVLVASDLSSPPTGSVSTSLNVRIGADNDLTGLHYAGSLGDIGLWARALSAQEALDLYIDPPALLRPRNRMTLVSVAPHVGNAYPPTVYTVQPSGDTLTVDPSGDTLGITGFVLPAITLAGVGEREVDAPAEIMLPAMTMLGIGGDVSTGTSAMTLAAMRMLGYTIPSAQGAGDVVLPAMVLLGNTEFIQGTADLDLPAMTMLAAVGISRDGTASMTLPAMQLDSVVRLGNFITSEMSLGAMGLSGAASFTTVESGTSAMTLPAMGVSGSASFTTVESGTSAMTLGAMSLSGAAAFVPTGTSAITLPAIAMDSQAASLPVTSDIVLPAMTLAGAGQTVWDGTSEMDLGALTMEGSGARDGLSTSAMTLGAVTMTGSASFTTIVVGSSAITLAAIEMKSAAAGIDTGESGTSEMVLAAVTMAAAGVKSGDGTSAMTLPAMELRGRGGLAADDEGQWFNVTHIEVDATGTDKILFLEPLTKPFQR